MSVLIKGMDMPVNCTLCFFKDSMTMYCPYEADKENDCPLVEVPTPHGSLIDADRVDDYIVGSVDLRDVPTIIEAEE